MWGETAGRRGEVHENSAMYHNLESWPAPWFDSWNDEDWLQPSPMEV
jgi:hypothetical protein